MPGHTLPVDGEVEMFMAVTRAATGNVDHYRVAKNDAGVVVNTPISADEHFWRAEFVPPWRILVALGKKALNG